MHRINNNLVYSEKTQSPGTQALFAGLAATFSLLYLWRRCAGRQTAWGKVFLAACGVFVFYTLNYRVLQIRLSPEILSLRFGIFTWNVPLENIAACALDDIAGVKKYGGAGIHFMSYAGRYRASFNFLEFPRLLISFKRKVGPVQEISFSTRHPETLLQMLPGAGMGTIPAGNP